jgi:hypothetical protein
MQTQSSTPASQDHRPQTPMRSKTYIRNIHAYRISPSEFTQIQSLAMSDAVFCLCLWVSLFVPAHTRTSLNRNIQALSAPVAAVRGEGRLGGRRQCVLGLQRCEPFFTSRATPAAPLSVWAFAKQPPGT